MKRIETIHTPKGYKFLLDNHMLGEGEYDGGKFLLFEDNDITEHDNAMIAMLHLNKKHNPEYYNRPVKPLTAVPRTETSKYKNHPALAGVTTEVMFAK